MFQSKTNSLEDMALTGPALSDKELEMIALQMDKESDTGLTLAEMSELLDQKFKQRWE